MIDTVGEWGTASSVALATEIVAVASVTVTYAKPHSPTVYYTRITMINGHSLSGVSPNILFREDTAYASA